MARLQSIATIVCNPDQMRRIGHNTYAWHDRNHSFELRYHRTNVVQFCADAGVLVVNTGGWFTNTTSERIHHALRQLDLRLSTTDLPNRWRVMDSFGNAWTIRGNSIKLRRCGVVEFRRNASLQIRRVGCNWERIL